MPPITIMDTVNVTMWYYPEKKILHHQYHKFMAGEPFRNFLLKGTETLQKYQATKWLSDDRNNPVLSPGDLEWGQKFWFPATLKAGWKYWAIVMPKHALAQMTMKELVDDYRKAGVSANFFSDPDEAMKWLESQPG